MKIEKNLAMLTEEELNNISGGVGAQYMPIACSECGTINTVNINLSEYTCKKCKAKHTISG